MILTYMIFRFLHVLSLFVFLLITPFESFAQAGWSEPYQNGVISAADEYASEAGIGILKNGGNAVDAAIAVQFVLAVTLPRAGNIGGGGFMVLHLNDGIVRTLDFREKAPAKAQRDMYLDVTGEYVAEKSREGVLAVGVPGTVDGMLSALERYGTMPLELIMEPAIRLARDGYELSHSHAKDLNDKADKLSMFESSKKYFLKPDGEKWEKGDLFVQPDLARTLRRIASYGRDGFYSGVTANQIIEEMRKTGGLIDLRDLRDYRSEWREPVIADFEGHTFYMMPPPSSGGVVLKQILQMVKDTNLKQYGLNSADYIHLLAEAMRRSFADRNYYLGDPDYAEIPMDQLLSENYAKERMSGFRKSQATESEDITHGTFNPVFEASQTTHFSVIDKNGNAVAVTTTLNGSFGSYLSVSNAGFLLNNEMDDFSAKPGEPNMFGMIGAEANAIEPGKRMLSSMSPTIVTKDGNVKMIAGAAGGPRIITATLQNILNVLLFEMNLHQAISAPRFHHQWLPDSLYLEEFGISQDTKSILSERGHDIALLPSIGRTHIIYADEDGLKYGAADPRGDGEVKGY